MFHEVLDVHDLPGTGFLDLGPYDVDVGDDPDDPLLLVDDGQIPETVTEKDAHGIVDIHGRDHAEGSPAHDRTEFGVGRIHVAEELLGRDITEQIAVLHHREAVEVGIDELLLYFIDRHVGGNVLDVTHHVIADRCCHSIILDDICGYMRFHDGSGRSRTDTTSVRDPGLMPRRSSSAL